MNLDVREYLRINPISVHQLTLSGSGRDCFLLFGRPDEDYSAVTQTYMFSVLVNMIFGELVSESRFNIDWGIWESEGRIQWNECQLSESQFSNYLKRGEYQPYHDSTDAWWDGIGGIQNTIEDRILAVKKAARLWYRGSVEIQSRNDAPVYRENNYYVNLEGLTWCYNTGSEVVEGCDQAEIPQTVKHSHPNSRAEAMTSPYSTRRYGGQIVGNYTIGSRDTMSSDRFQKNRVHLSPMSTGSLNSSGMTQPLYGQNLLDWRNRTQPHNNIPPSTNVLFRECRTEVPVQVIDRQPRQMGLNGESRDDSTEIQDENLSYVEAQYYSDMVSNLESYSESMLTDHDYLLRITTDGSPNLDDMQLMKQSVKMLLGIFSDDTFNALNIKNSNGKVAATMEEILKEKLDELLVPKSEFQRWYNSMMDKILELSGRIQELRQVLKSVKPMTYVGRVIVSTTDDTERKVIQKYGGKRWRRIVNFLRGVNDYDQVGKMLGEEYVCLRESNVPVHSHDMESEEMTDNVHIQKDAGGAETRILNEQTQIQIQSNENPSKRTIDYQISPLEFGQKTIFLPHDNMPPYREVYIWECTELTDEEKDIVGETAYCTVQFNTNGGNPPYLSARQVQRGHEVGELPTETTREGHVLSGWTDSDGMSVSPQKRIYHNTTFYASWMKGSYTVTYNFGGGRMSGGNPDDTYLKVTDFYGKRLLPPEVEWEGHRFVEWNPPVPETMPDGGGTYTATWDTGTYLVKFDANGGEGGTEQSLPFGDDMPDPPDVTWTGHRLLEWQPTPPDKVPGFNSTYYAQWEVGRYLITFDGNGGTGGWSQQMEYGKPITAPQVERRGHQFTGWNPAPDETVPDGDRTYVAGWQTNTYTVTFNPNGGTGGWSQQMEYGSPITPPTVARDGYDMNGWDPAVDATVPDHDVEYAAKWNPRSFQITFRANGGIPETTWETMPCGEPLSAPVVVKPGYFVEKWLDSEDPESGQHMPLTVPPHDQTYYAHWRKHLYRIVFDANGGTGGYSELKEFEQPIEVPTVSREGCTSYTWDPQPPATVPAMDCTFRAIWTPIEYAVTYDLNGYEAEIPSSLRTTYTVLDVERSPYRPQNLDSVEGCTFIGWEPSEIPVGSMGDFAFSAMWRKQEHVVQWDANGGGTPSEESRTVYHGEELGELPTSEREGYHLLGWTTEPDGTEFVHEDTVITSSRRFYAKWEENASLTVTYRDNKPVTITYETNF